MDKNLHYLYKITNILNNNIYIGFTNNIKRRINEYKNLNCKNQKLLYYSISKYGWENHKFEVFCTCIPEISSSLEIYFIKYYNTQRINNYLGLNLSSGGNNYEELKKRRESKERRLQKQKLNRTSIFKSVSQYDLNGNFIKFWDYIMQVERDLKICHINIIKCCKGERNSAGNFQWRYTSHYNNEIIPLYINNHFQKINQLTLNGNLVKTWSSIKEAADTLNYSANNISRVCGGRRNKYKNYIWQKVI
jgi:group I intron endonuclease